LTANGFGAQLEGNDRAVSGVNTLEEAGPDELSFLSNIKYLKAVQDTRAAALLVQEEIPVPSHVSAVRCKDPYAAVTLAIIHLHGHRRHPQWGISPKAEVHKTAKVGADPNFGPGATVAAGAVLGDRCTLYPGSYVGDAVRMGDDCTLFPNAVVYDGCILGHRVTVHAGSVIGQDGLGYAPHDGRWIKIPQVGRTVVGDDVEIGANCAIDRATLGRTEIGNGTKFGNLIVIGHGTKVGPDCMFVGLVGVAGSVKIGRHVTLAGQVGIAGHLSIGDDVTVGAQSGIMSDVESNTSLLGAPAVPVEDAKRLLLLFQRLPEMSKRIKELEQQVRRLNERAEAVEPMASATTPRSR
jgi:UDP-3-O-[3-hydroxymyristoyl] glucosamine N-acyltransferase